MMAADLIRVVEQAGGRLEPDGDGLVVEAPEPLPEPIMLELRAHKAEVIEFLKRPVAKVVLLHCPSGVPDTWVQGVADLLAMTPPALYLAEEWAVLCEDAYQFLRHHAAQAHALGWTAPDLFGVHRHRPQVRLDCMGLVPLLRGREVAALSENQAAIKTTEDQVLTYRQKRGTRQDGACLLWELRV